MEHLSLFMGMASNWPNNRCLLSSADLLMLFEVLNFALVLFGFFECAECSEVAAFSRRWIFFSRIQTIFAGFQLAYHIFLDARRYFPDVFAV